MNSYRKDKATLLNCTSVVNKKPANQVAASEIIYPVPTRDLAGKGRLLPLSITYVFRFVEVANRKYS